jgi:hypothetical protein
MSKTAVAVLDVSAFGGRSVPLGGLGRWLLRSTALAGAAVAAVAATGAMVTVLAGWMAHVALSNHSQFKAQTDSGPRAIALAPQTRGGHSGVASARSMKARLARAYALARELDARSPHRLNLAAIPPQLIPLPPSAPRRAAERVAAIPLPLARPALPEIARAPEPEPTAKVAAVVPAQPSLNIAKVAPPPSPTPEKRAALPPANEDRPALPAPGSRTAVYDIAAHTVYLPNGRKLEAHSGIGERMDDPRFVRVRMRGPTPPNEYRLTLREQPFHGVQAIRLNPVDEDRMFGRDGMLAHTYMLGPSGQSNGCVSFRHYDQFLQAYLDGEIDRLVVVPHLEGGTAPRVARAAHRDRYAYND